MLVGVEYNKNANGIVASYYNKAGKIDRMIKRLNRDDVFNWKLSNGASPYKSWDEKPVEKANAYNLSRYRIEEILLSKFTDKERDILYSDNWPVVHYLDIEVEVNENNDFPDAELAEFPVNLVTMVAGDRIYVLSTMIDLPQDRVDAMERNVNEYFRQFGIETNYKAAYFFFETEEKLLTAFFHKILPKVNFITGWNVIEFDWVTLYNRAEINNIDQFKMLWSRKSISRSRIPVHLGMLDYMVICQEFKPIKMAENYTLDYTADKILGVKKLSHPYGSFYEFQKDPEMFTEYCMIDSCLVQLIENERHLLLIAYEMANIAQLEVSRVFGPVFKTEIFLCREFYKQGLHMPDIKKGGVKKKYPGAYVMPPIPGYYNNVGCFDFASQYPNIQIQWYIDPKGYIGKVNEVNLSEYDARSIVVTKYNTVFHKNDNCASRMIQMRLYNKRFEIKGPDGELQQIKRRMNALREERARLMDLKT